MQGGYGVRPAIPTVTRDVPEDMTLPSRADRAGDAALLAGLALATRISVGSLILFRQRRIGLDGIAFDMLKFRTMKHPTEAGESKDHVALPSDTAPGGVEGEDRRTRVGKLLRATSLDELPQLFNVLRGEMSLVGPRPLPERDYERLADWHRKRYLVLPGMTGLWQVSGRS